jgi:DNA-binding HxlR family transcriptional regulator
MTHKLTQRSDCPISCSLDIWGDKWSLLIIRNIMFHNMHRYGEFLQAPEKIATNILADRLVSLEHAGLISKEEHPESKAKFFYTLTRKGVDLLPVMVEISIWGNKYFTISPEAKALVKRAKHGRKEFLHSLSAQFKKTANE